MALAVDSQEASGVGHNNIPAVGVTTGTLTWTFNNVAGNLLLVGIVVTNSGGVGTVSIGTVSYNSVNMTAIGTGQTWDSNANIVQWFKLVNPATGSKTVSVGFSVTTNLFFGCIAGAISFSGADTTTPTGSEFKAKDETGTNNHPTITVTGTTSGNYVVAAVGTGTGVTGAHSGEGTLTWLLNVDPNTAGDNAAALYKSSSGGSVVTGFDITADYWGIVAVEVKAAAAAATTNRLASQGVG